MRISVLQPDESCESVESSQYLGTKNALEIFRNMTRKLKESPSTFDIKRGIIIAYRRIGYISCIGRTGLF